MRLEDIIIAIENLNNEDFVTLAQRVDAQRKKRAQSILDMANVQASMLAGSAFNARKKRAPSTPKYRDPQTGMTWSGQGRQPKWFSDCLARGMSEHDLLIK